MFPFLRSSILASALATACGGAIAGPSPSDAIQHDIRPQRYRIEFSEPGLLARLPENQRRGGVTTAASGPERDRLMLEQATHKAVIASELGRSIDVSHHFLASHSGIGMVMSAVEAERVRQLPGIVTVEPERIEQPSTFRSPTLIGADSVWNGSATPGAVGRRGEGMVVGILDTGIVPSHPSFANDASCGHGIAGVPDKLIDFVDCATTDASGMCNGPTLDDAAGHGTHVAATAAGNRLGPGTLPSPRAPVSGVAPCASIRAYKVCIVDGCPSLDILAGLDSVLIDGDVDVINFSISGGIDPWSDNDRRKLDLVDAGVVVVAAAGNMGSPFIPRPESWVNHRAPWVIAVAATSHDARDKGIFRASGVPGIPEAAAAMLGHLGSDSPASPAFSNLPVRHFAGQADGFEGCSAGVDGAPADLPAFPAGYFDGAAALITSAECPVATQIDNAVAAGAQLVLIRAYYESWGSGNYSIDTLGAASVPVYGMGWRHGDALQRLTTENPGQIVLAYQPVAGEALAPFSLRGPLAAPYENISKPDIAAPGLGILAAMGDGYRHASGTSMASPHVAGAALLVRQMHPDWTVDEVASALRTTASSNGLDDDFTSAWDADAVGNGRVDLSRAGLAGLVLDETTANFVAANPAGGTRDVRDLNLAALRDTDCIWQCDWKRRLRNTLPGESHWVAHGASTSGDIDIGVSPNRFTMTDAVIAPPAADTLFADGFDGARPVNIVELTVTASPLVDLAGRIAFGEVVLVEENGRSPPIRLTVAVGGKAGGLGTPAIRVPATIDAAASTMGGVVSLPLRIDNTGNGSLAWSRANALTPRALWQQPANGTAGVTSDYSSTQAGGIYVANDFVLTSRAALTRIVAPGFDNTNSLPAQSRITWTIHADAAGKPSGHPETTTPAALWRYSAAPTATGVDVSGGTISLDLAAIGEVVDLPAGTYWLSVHPTYANSITGANPRWNWRQAALVGATSQVISPRIYGTTSWAPITSIGAAFRDTAFDLHGTVGGHLDCAAGWLSMAPSSGTIPHHQAETATLQLNPAGLAAGVHESHVCIDSNDPALPTAIVPVRFTVH